MPSTGELFLMHSINKLKQMSGYIEVCLDKLTPDQVWQHSGEVQNSVGNLVLHLCGNVRQWIGWSIGGLPDIRHREQEFSSRQVALPLKATVQEAVLILEKMSPERLAERVATQDGERSALEVIYQVVGHFQQHTGQIMFATKLMTGEDLEFYKQSP